MRATEDVAAYERAEDERREQAEADIDRASRGGVDAKASSSSWEDRYIEQMLGESGRG